MQPLVDIERLMWTVLAAAADRQSHAMRVPGARRCGQILRHIAAFCCALFFITTAFGQNAPQTKARLKPSQQVVKQSKLPEFEVGSVKTTSGIATWYDVGPNSIPMRRAPGELIAAHDTLPLGSYVRVTSRKTGLSVIVRITDRGVRKKGAIDLCKEAAEKIGLVGVGIVKVQMEILKPKVAVALATPTASTKPASDVSTVAPAVIPKDAMLPPVPSP